VDEIYPLAPQGVFLTVNGEGQFLGQPQVFVRLAGCNVGCPGCDTNYTVAFKATAREIARQVASVAGVAKWVWLTGGEPTIHDLPPLVDTLRRYGFRVAVATAGTANVRLGSGPATNDRGGADFVSVSPHFLDDRWVLRRGDQVNLVPGLNGLRLEDAEGVDFGGFSYRYVTPFWYDPADRMEKVWECYEWVQRHPGFRLGVQAHKLWQLP
jgi:7-carboxy-7-deazaguanine synthase